MSNEYLLQMIDDLEAQISDLRGQLNMKVDKGDIINQINISDEGIRLKGSKIIIDEGTIDASEINTINLD